MQTVFRGSATALVTPFDDRGELDLAALERLIEFQIENGTKALILLGTTGEPSTLTAEEKELILRLGHRTVRGRVPLIAGTGGNNTRQVISDTRHAKELGADAVLLVTPYYNKTTQKGLVSHYRMIEEASDLPYIVYNVPGRTGLNLAPGTMKEIAEFPHCAGLKDASASMTQGLETMRLCPGMPVYCGSDELNYPYLASGAAGTISVLSNLLPGDMNQLNELVMRGEYKQALEVHQRMAPLTSALFAQTSPIPVKSAMAIAGLCGKTLRPPLFSLTEEEEGTLRTIIESY